MPLLIVYSQISYNVFTFRLAKGWNLTTVCSNSMTYRSDLPMDLARRRTDCVTCVWAGVDNAWEQRKLEARKMLLKSRRLPPVGCTEKERGSFFTPETVQRMGKVYSQATDLQAVQSSGGMPKRHPRGAPWLPVPLIYALVARGERPR